MAGLPQEGREFGRYQIVRRIGRGGMGVVYAAVQKGLGREVALKVLSSDLAEDDGYRKRFLREAEVLARLDSPHIIQVHDAGEQDGWLYIATQLVPDGDLQEALNANGPLPDHRALDILGQVAAGVHAAHEAGIIHRDIKPSNVLLRRRSDESIQAYVCDLGISQLLDSEHTKTQGVIGTFAYMAPERHEGHDATMSSDIYALGCLLWAAVSGEAPYRGTDGQVLMGHLNGPIPRLAREDHVARGINEVLRRSMAKDPADRHRSAQEFAAACAAIVATEQPDQAPTRLPTDRPPGPARAPMTPTPWLTPTYPPPPSTGPQGPYAGQATSGQNGYTVAHGAGHQGPPPQLLAPVQQFASGPHPSYGQAPPRKGNTWMTWLVGGLAAAILGGVGAVVIVMSERDEGSDGKDDRSNSASTVPDDASMDDFCSHYADSPDMSIESIKDYAETMEEMGTPSGIPDDAREAFLWQIGLAKSAESVSEFTAGYNNKSPEEASRVQALDDWATANCA
ncbi:hypothetical protein ASG90_11525 [Nocardioides sp. Soil797]|nr:hypothetical protein ASG90_11525 [Nocardioides sp. Soil797]